MDADAAGAVIDAAQDCGVTLLDTADVYGGKAGPGASETILGEVLACCWDQLSWPRSSAWTCVG